MIKKVFFTALILFGLLFCRTPVNCFADTADVSAQFKQAEKYEEDGKYKDAEAIYKGIAEAYAGKEDGLKAQQKLVCLYIERGRTAEAETAYQRLLAGYTGYGDDNVIADAVDEVADVYRDVKKYDKALEIYSYVVDTWPESEQAMGSQGCIARVNIELGREEAAQAAIDKLIGSFSSNEGIADAVDEVADEYREVKKYEKALGLYKYIVNTWPDSEQACGSLASIAKLHIEFGDDPNCQAVIDRLITNFGNREGAGTAIHEIAYTYHHQARQYDKARELYEWVVKNRPADKKAIRAQMGIAKIYIVLGDDPNAQAAIDKLVADYSENEGIAKALDHLADDYRELGKYERARELYQCVVDNWPDYEHAVESQAGVARASILLGDNPNAQVAIDRLLSDFSDNNNIARAVDHLADEYRKLGRYAEAQQLYQYIVETWPEHTMESQKGLARASIGLGDDPNAQAAVEKLAADFWQDTGLPAALCEIAQRYERARQYQQARDVYELILHQFPGSTSAEKAELDVAKIDVILCVDVLDDATVQQEVEALIADFNGHWYLPEAVLAVGRDYCIRGFLGERHGLVRQPEDYLTAAIPLLEQTVALFPSSSATPHVLHLAGDCYSRLGEYERALACYRRIVADWPNHQHTGRAQFLIGHVYEKMKRAGLIDEAVADTPVRVAYQCVVAEYPDCEFVKAAKDWLAWHPRED